MPYLTQNERYVSASFFSILLGAFFLVVSMNLARGAVTALFTLYLFEAYYGLSDEASRTIDPLTFFNLGVLFLPLLFGFIAWILALFSAPKEAVLLGMLATISAYSFIRLFLWLARLIVR